MPIVSRAAIKDRFEGMLEGSPCDPVLLEYRLASEFMARGLVERISPIYVGDFDSATGAYSDFFCSGCAPNRNNKVSENLEGKFQALLEEQALGTPLQERMSVTDIFDSISSHLGGRIDSAESLDVILDKRADEIVKIVQELVASSSSSSESSGGGGASPRSLRCQLQQEKERTEAALKAREEERVRAVEQIDAERAAKVAAEARAAALEQEIALLLDQIADLTPH